ncbi:DoxX family protein [Leucobacter sp. CSA1]|uniref:DoxX family protein n=1 Tax=Leucobacter chromiisoli TaxID=2796471 RepID=A0A934Q847_9MICO|nr:DoxX family protein [Leucobacter chromiisoli]MBK0419468.1 DoxX family protein [Leucobacter chromiisoli]
MSTSPVDFAIASSTGLVAFALVLSGAMKLGRSASTLAAMAALRVPAVLRRRPLAAALPVWELLLAAGFLFASGVVRAVTAWLAVGTLFVFTLFLAGVLSRHEEVDCGCFGPLSASDRVTGWSILRNSILTALALTVAVGAAGHGSLFSTLAVADLAFVLGVALSWAAVAILLLLLALWKARGGQRSRHQKPGIGGSENEVVPGSIDMMTGGASIGDPIPDVEVVSDTGIPVGLRRLGRGAPVLLLFLSAECSSCVKTAARVPQWQEQLAPARIRVLTSSRPDVVRHRFPDAAPYARYASKAAMRALGVQGGPAAVVLGGLQQPVVASPVAYGLEEIEALVRGVLEAGK